MTDAAWDETEAKHVKDAHAQAVKVIDREYWRVPEHPGDPLFYTLFGGLFKTLGRQASDLRRCMRETGVLNNPLGIAADIYESKSH